MFLYINPSEANKISLKLFNSKKISARTVLKGGVKVTERLVDAILKLLAKNKTSLNVLNGIVLVIGPGGFTSLRICCVIVNTLSQLYKIPTYGALAAQLDDDKKLFAAIKKLKKNRILLPAYDREPNITISK